MPFVFLIIGFVVGAGILFFVNKDKIDPSVLEAEKQKALNSAEQDFEDRKQQLTSSLKQDYEADKKLALATLEQQSQNQISELQANKTYLESQTQQLKARISELETQESQVGELQTRISELEAQASQVSELRQELAQQKSNHQLQIEDYESQIDSLRETITRIQVATPETDQLQEAEKTPEDDDLSSVSAMMANQDEETIESQDIDTENSFVSNELEDIPPTPTDMTTENLAQLEDITTEEIEELNSVAEISDEVDNEGVLKLEDITDEQIEEFDDAQMSIDTQLDQVLDEEDADTPLDIGNDFATDEIEQLSDSALDFNEGGDGEIQTSLELEDSEDFPFDFGSDETEELNDSPLDLGAELPGESPEGELNLSFSDDDLNLDALDGDSIAESEELFDGDLELELSEDQQLTEISDLGDELFENDLGLELELPEDQQLTEISSPEEAINFDPFATSAKEEESTPELDLSSLSDEGDEDLDLNLDFGDDSDADEDFDLDSLLDDEKK